MSVYEKALPQISTSCVRIEDQILPDTSKYPFFCSEANSNINQVHILSHNKILNTLLEGKKTRSAECSVQQWAATNTLLQREWGISNQACNKVGYSESLR